MRHARADALRAVHIAVSKHEQLIESTRQILAVLSQWPQVQNVDVPACSTLFSSLQKQYPSYTAIGLIDLTGNIICSSLPLREPVNVAQNPYFQGAILKRGFIISPYLIDIIPGKATVIMAYPALDPAGEVRSVIFAALDLGWLNGLAPGSDLAEGADFTIIDSTGVVLARYPDPENWFGKKIPDAPLVRLILEQKQGVVEASGLEGTEKLFAFMPLSEISGGAAYVSVGIPTHLAYEEAIEAIPRGLIGVIALVLVFAAWYFGDVLLLRRVNLLKDTARSLAAGDLSVRTGVISPREDISNLLRSFDEMADALAGQQDKLRRSEANLRKTVEGTINAMACTIESRDPYTAGHQKRVSDIACAIAIHMGLPEEQVEGIRMAGLIHDLGKIAVPADILSKPGKINEHEFAIMRSHPRTGYDILRSIEFPWPVADAAYQHHERLDGTGYPRQLRGDEIILEARILAVADVIEAMASHRPYRAALGLNMAIQEIERGRGIIYDAAAVDACMSLFKEGSLETLIIR